jgi:hypothetical protein
MKGKNVTDFNLKIVTNVQNNNIETENDAGGTSNNESTPICWNVDQGFFLCKNTIFTVEVFSLTFSSCIEVNIYLMQKYLP